MSMRRKSLPILFFTFAMINGCAFSTFSDLFSQAPDKPPKINYLAEVNIDLCVGLNVDPRPQSLATTGFVNVRDVTLLVSPVRDACVSSGVGFRKSRNRQHKGVDYSNRHGGPVVAAASGKIYQAELNNSYGHMVVIKHSNSVYTRYAHLKHDLVNVGEDIELGQILGEMGNSGLSTGTHLHYEILVDEANDGGSPYHFTAIDPFDQKLSYTASR